MQINVGLPPEDYVQKYQPLLYLLESEHDVDQLVFKPGYSLSLGLRHKFSRAIALQQIALELEVDFRALFESAKESALQDDQLATRLVRIEKTVHSIAWRIRLRGIMSCFIPSPRPRRPLRAARRLPAKLLDYRALTLKISAQEIWPVISCYPETGVHHVAKSGNRS